MDFKVIFSFFILLLLLIKFFTNQDLRSVRLLKIYKAIVLRPEAVVRICSSK